MNDSNTIRVNARGGIFDNGRSFTKSKWYEIVLEYENILSVKGKCTVRMLAAGAKISLASANKAMIYYDIGMIIPPISKRGHCKSGIGSLSGMRMKHHMYMYRLYLDNPALLVHGYIEELFNKFGLIVSSNIIQR